MYVKFKIKLCSSYQNQVNLCQYIGFIYSNKCQLEPPTLTRSKLPFQAENLDFTLPTNLFGKEDANTGINENKGVGGLVGVEESEVIKKRTPTRAVRLLQRLRK